MFTGERSQIAYPGWPKLPGAPLPTTLGVGSTTLFPAHCLASSRLAYILLSSYNVTNGIEGYKVEGLHEKQFSGLACCKYPGAHLHKDISVCNSTEEQHIAINVLLATAQVSWQICPFTNGLAGYQFPVDNLKDANPSRWTFTAAKFLLSQTFTALVPAAFQDANVVFALQGFPEVVRLISSVIGTEGHQEGFDRIPIFPAPSRSTVVTTVLEAEARPNFQRFTLEESHTEDIYITYTTSFPTVKENGGGKSVLEAEDQSWSLRATHAESDYFEHCHMTFPTGLLLPVLFKSENLSTDGKGVKLDSD
ncbi:hypothetical protein CEK25_013082 [Fusarium fujikuroi]|nr:hypothetical protein CEK25_013082 [Fusarium fujikuroi]